MAWFCMVMVWYGMVCMYECMCVCLHVCMYGMYVCISYAYARK